MAKIFGFGSDDGNIFDAVKDMTDGGGAGQSGSQFSTEGGIFDSDGNNDYVEKDKNFKTTYQGGNDDGDDDSGGSSAATTALNIVAPITFMPKLLGGVVNWINGIGPDDDEVEGAVGANGEALQVFQGGADASIGNYAKNFLGLPYEVVEVNGQWVDALKVPVNPQTGERITAEQVELLKQQGITAITGYEYNKAQAQDSGDNDSVSELEKYEAANDGEGADGTEGETEKTTLEQIQEWAKSTGMDLQNEDIKAIVDDPKAWAESRNLKLEDLVPTLDANAEGTTLDGTDPKYSIGDSDALNIETATAGEASTINSVTAATPVTYEASTNLDKMDSSFDVNAATGTIDDDNLVDASAIEIDMTGAATGVNEDGTINYTGVAANDYATQKFSTIIDTSTVSGKNLAKALGEGNYVDEKATIAGQMKIISEQFVNDQGQAVIPKWAQKMARSVAQTMAFDGITGSAQTSAMATAIMEATLGIAEKEATFFQTLTTKNLDNRQEAIINKANILSRFEVANLGARQAAAVQNAKSFLEMDLKNLTNEQQAEVINKQAKTQALFEDSKIINAQRLFTAEQTNDFNKFYDELNVAVEKHNSSEINSMKKFNAGEINDTREFNAELEDARARFYSTMQYNIDTANAKWRQEVTVKQFQATVDAINTDVKNSLDLATEGMNQLWDRTDSLLDFIFRKEEGDANRTVTLLGSQLSAQAQQEGGSSWWETILSVGGTLLGTSAGSEAAIKFIKSLSDVRLKKNVRKIDTINGINIYSWQWNDEGLRLGADQNHTTGFIAQDLIKTHPEAISKHDSGYLMVDYKAVHNGLH